MFKHLLKSLDPAHGAPIILQRRIMTKSSSLKIGASLRSIDGEKKIVMTSLSSDGERNVVFEDDEVRQLISALTECLGAKQS